MQDPQAVLIILVEGLATMESFPDINLQFLQRSLGQPTVLPRGGPKAVYLLLVSILLRDGADFLTN